MIEDDSSHCSILLIDDEPFAQQVVEHGLKATVVLVDLRMPWTAPCTVIVPR